MGLLKADTILAMQFGRETLQVSENLPAHRSCIVLELLAYGGKKFTSTRLLKEELVLRKLTITALLRRAYRNSIVVAL